MNLIDFTKQFPDEASCIKYFREEKERRLYVIYATLLTIPGDNRSNISGLLVDNLSISRVNACIFE